MRNRITHAIEHGWLSKGETGSPNYDEYASESEVAAAISAHPTSVLSAEMPHLTPDGLSHGYSLADALSSARNTWNSISSLHMREVDNVVGIYRIITQQSATETPSTRPGDKVAPTGEGSTATAQRESWGLFCMVDTSEISSGPEEPGRVIRNEDVFDYKVMQRVVLAGALEAALSPVLLLATETGEPLRNALSASADSLGAPSVVDVDEVGAEHTIWLVTPGTTQSHLLEIASADNLVVADGNHRSLAARKAGLDRFLAVITTGSSVKIAPYNRLLTELPTPFTSVLERLTAAGCVVSPVFLKNGVSGRGMTPFSEKTGSREGSEPTQGTVVLYADGQTYRIQLPSHHAELPNDETKLPKDGGELPGSESSVVDRLDHSVTEKLLFGEILGLDPGDKRISYIGGNYSDAWLMEQVDSGVAAMAVLIAPVSVDDFIAVNLARSQMPRKSTWFTPKARAGLLCAAL